MKRTVRERVLQALMFEVGGLILAVPLYEAVFVRTTRESFDLLLALSIAVLIWTPIHNALFDRAEQALTNRALTQRPHPVRVLHAFSHELTPLVVTLPLIMVMGQHSLGAALAVNCGLTVVYVGYAYVFYLIYDLFRPVPQPHPAQQG